MKKKMVMNKQLLCKKIQKNDVLIHNIYKSYNSRLEPGQKQSQSSWLYRDYSGSSGAQMLPLTAFTGFTGSLRGG
jgi:hypothetical protein